MSPERDVEEFWRLIESAPPCIEHRDGDADGYHMDLICRAGKEVARSETLRTTIEFLMVKHALAGFLRPAVMIVARSLHDSVREYAKRRGTPE